MLKVAINTHPLKSAHKRRGIGYYTQHLLEHLEKDETLDVIPFERQSDLKAVDLVHYPWYDLFFHTLPIKKKFPTIVTIHDVIPLIFPNHFPLGLKGKINFFLQKIALLNCKYIITDSEISRQDIVKYLKVTNEKIVVIPLAADSKFKVLSDTKLLFVKRKYHLPDQFLLYIGDAGWSKNLPFLVEGFNKLIKDYEVNDLILILIGGVFLKNVENIEHPELESLKQVNQLIKKYGLEDKIVKMGDIESEDLVAIYNMATIYIQPSLYEGFGLPVLEAMACGTAVVSSNAGSLREVGGDAAVYFNPTNIDQLKSIILEVLQNKSLRNKLSKLGLDQAAKFSWEKVAWETKQIYVKILENSKK